MRYQIYLNKLASRVINELAKDSNMKPCSVIKAIIEGSIDNSVRLVTEELKLENPYESKK